MRKKLIFPQGEGDEIIQISPDGWFLLPSPFGGERVRVRGMK